MARMIDLRTMQRLAKKVTAARTKKALGISQLPIPPVPEPEADPVAAPEKKRSHHKAKKTLEVVKETAKALKSPQKKSGKKKKN